eukprot:4237964-Ditylum_brightwellii.AAC.1
MDNGIEQNDDDVNYMTEDDGIPKIKNPTNIDKYDTCLTCKMWKAVKSHGDIRKGTEVTGQGLLLDWGFIVQKSKNQDRVNRLTSINGFQSYLLVVDHHSDRFWPLCSDSKSPPLSWLNCLLTKISPNHENKCVCMDLGSELGRNVEIKKLLTKHGYDIYPTGSDAFHQNSPGERPHETIGDA